MNTFTLKEASNFMNMHWQTLRAKAKTGEIPGAKISKQWVFIEEDLVEYIRSQYSSPRSRSQVQRMGESICYTNDQTLNSIGAGSQHQTEKEYKNLLKQ